MRGATRRAAGWERLAGWLTLLTCTAITLWRFLELHALLAPAAAPTLEALASVAHTAPAGYGWWSWWDQSWYLESALAWSQGRLDPALHWYPPGYPMFGALFTAVTPADPFMIPNLLCLAASLWLFAALCGELSGRRPWGRALGAVLFVATSVWPARVAWAWVVPWTTTPETVCLLACLLGTARFVRGLGPADAFLAGLAAVATLAFRPADAALVGGACAVACAGAVVARWPGRVRAVRVGGAALAGAALPALVFGGAYLAVNGLALDGYLTTSAAFGFEWRLLPLRWVTIMIDPRPLFMDGEGLVQVFPWIVPGLAGMAACVWARSGSRLIHAAVATAVVADMVQYVCYRDLHPDYLWRNGIFHYFKWTLPVFALYAVLLVRAFVAGPRLPPAMALAAVLCLFSWRVTVTGAAPIGHPADARSLTLPHGVSDLRDVVFVRTAPGQTALIPFDSDIRTGGRVFRSSYDFKLTPWSETLMLQPLRAMPDAPSVLQVAPGFDMDPAVAAVQARTTLQWALPCWLSPRSAACLPIFALPAPPLDLATPLPLGPDAAGERYRLSGLSSAEAAGDWTDGPHAAFWFRLPPGAHGLGIAVTAHGFVPDGGPSHVTATLNGVQIGRWRFGAEVSVAESAIPDAALRPDGNAVLDLVVSNPRAPADYYAASADLRALGIQISSLQVHER